MVFHSLDFFILFAVTVILYYVLPQKFQNIVLLLSSYVFYAAFDIKLIGFLIVVTAFAYFVALNIDNCYTGGQIRFGAKLWLLIGIGICLAPLVFYKYSNFILSLFAKIIGYGHEKRIELLAPLGISFITFSLLSYIVDVYKGTIKAERNILKFALFVAFFPKLAQGPIEKAGDILPQFDRERCFDLICFREGMLLALYGLFMKMVIADTAGIAVDKIYGELAVYSGAAVLLATVLFTIQIYCDFAGYSLIAIGTAKVLGFDFKRNFRQPYLSISVSEFWRRWHISLNQWLTDYIYIPLGGSRCSKVRRMINVLVTFALSGLWHGAAGGYIIWGLLNGVYVVAEFMGNTIASTVKTKSPLYEKMADSLVVSSFKKVLVFLLIMLSWIFFRAQHCNVAITAIRRIIFDFDLRGFLTYASEKIASGAGTTLYGLDVAYNIPVLLVGILVVVVVDIVSEKKNLVSSLSTCNRIIRWMAIYMMIFVIIIFGVYGYGYNSSDFIYTGF